MGKINKLTKQGETVYPITVSDAVINPDTRRSVTQELKRTLQATGVGSFEDFSAEKDYAAGDKVWYDDTLYEFTAAHPKGQWTGTDVRETSFKKDLDRIFSFEENPEFVYSVLDSEGKLLLGIKENGEPYFPKNETYRVESNQEFLAAWLDASGHVLFGLRQDGSAYVAKADFIDKIERIQKLLEENGIGDSQLAETVSGLQSDVAGLSEYTATLREDVDALEETFSFASNDEWLHAVVDAEGKLLFGIKAENGEVVMPKQDTYKVVSNDEWLAAWVDSQDKILFGVKADGTFWAAKHNFSTGGNYDGEIEDINNTLSSMQGTIKDLADKISGIDTSGVANTVFSVIDDAEERLAVTTDNEEKVLSYRDKDGVLHENKGFDTSKYYLNGEEKNFIENLTDLEDVDDHNTPNLLIAAEMHKTFSDGTNSFTPPNEGYEMSNPIECKAGDWFTRTGTATGMVVVTDENDKNGTRLFNADGTTLPNTFQIPQDMTWVRYIRMAADKALALSGNVVICKGKKAYLGDNVGDFITIEKFRLQINNIPNDIRYLKTTDGRYWEVYIDETDFTVKAREIDPEVITNLPSDFPVYTITGDFSEYFDTWLTTCGFYAIVRNKNGVIKYRNMGQNLSISEFRKATNSSGKTRYLCANDATVSKGTLVIYDENLEVVDVTATADGHDFVYFDDDHIASFQEETINEYKKIDGIWQIVGQFKVGDYPKLKTDMYGIYESPETIDVHSNTLSIDYDNNFIFNMRNNDSFIKIKRTENDDGTVTIGSKTLDYDEAIIGRVGGKYNSGYLDSKRVIEEGFHFTDVPTTLKDRSTDERPIWQWYHAHDVTYWGMKTIGEKQYPTYTLFDNNMWTNNAPELAGNIYNYNDINPRNNYENNPTAVSSGAFEESKSDGGGSYDTHMVSRIVQLSIDWDNHLIKDYKVYIIPKKYSSTASGVQMFDEGVLLIAWANQGFIGLYDFNDEQTQTEDKIYTNGKELFTAKRPQYTPGFYRIHGYKK